MTALAPGRLLFAPRSPRRHYLRLFNEADIALDPLPYNGGVTSCDAMYMGVPLVSLAGTTYHARQGLMLLTNVGLPELVAKTPDEYVSIAASLAKDPTRLAALRAGLRERLRSSPRRGLPADVAGLLRPWKAHSNTDMTRFTNKVPFGTN
jgi:predicted O-linked N-acetylglucosamine transferase (SPINDLY family)